MSAERPTRREITNWLTLARGGPYRLKCARGAYTPAEIIWECLQVDIYWTVFRGVEPIVTFNVQDPFWRWQYRFPQ